MHYVLIVGSSGQIGNSIVELYLKNNFNVIGIDISPSEIKHKNFTYFSCDISESSSIDKLFFQVNKLTEGKKIKDIIYTCAIQTVNDYKDFGLEELQISLRINAIAQVDIFQRFECLLEKDFSSFLSINSIHSYLTKKRFMNYSSSKKLSEGLMDAIALEFADHRIRILQVFPAAIDTKMLRDGLGSESFKIIKDYHPTRDIGRPEELADLIFKILSVESNFLNGVKINFDGGISKLLHDPSS